MVRMISVGAFGLVLAIASGSAAAVSVELSSPDAGQTLAPGDTLTLTVVVTNDTSASDRVVAKTSVVIGDATLGCQGQGALQASIAPGESATKTLILTIPKSLVLLGPVTGTAEVVATSRRTGAVASDSLEFTVAP